jgi:hypothetical protein
LYSSPDISRIINEIRKHLACMREVRNTFKISARKLNLRLKLNRRKIFKYILKKYDVKEWMTFICFRIRANHRFL